MRIFLILGIFLFLLPARAGAVEIDPYLNLFPLNPVFVPSATLTNPSNGATVAKANYNVGLGFFGAVGLMFDETFLLEIEGGYTDTSVSSLASTSAQATDSDTVKFINVMINAYYRSAGWADPTGLFTYHYYFGGGGGQAQQDLFLQNLTQGNDRSLAWQAVLGLELAPTHHRKFLNGSLIFQYKFLSITDGQLGAVKVAHDLHFLSLGIRFY